IDSYYACACAETRRASPLSSDRPRRRQGTEERRLEPCAIGGQMLWRVALLAAAVPAFWWFMQWVFSEPPRGDLLRFTLPRRHGINKVLLVTQSPLTG